MTDRITSASLLELVRVLRLTADDMTTERLSQRDKQDAADTMLEAANAIESLTGEGDLGGPPTSLAWQKIETAPMDGTRFLFTNNRGFTGIGRFLNGHAFAADSWGGVRYTIPHRWMPLPSSERSEAAPIPSPSEEELRGPYAPDCVSPMCPHYQMTQTTRTETELEAAGCGGMK